MQWLPVIHCSATPCFAGYGVNFHICDALFIGIDSKLGNGSVTLDKKVRGYQAVHCERAKLLPAQQKHRVIRSSLLLELDQRKYVMENASLRAVADLLHHTILRHRCGPVAFESLAQIAIRVEFEVVQK